MTTSNGDRGRIAEHILGVVASSNARGLKLRDHDDYLNFSRYADPPIAPPRRGANVRLGLDADGYIRELAVLNEPANTGAPGADRERIITRMSVLRSAATFVGGYAQSREDVKSSDVLAIADAWLKWVEQEHHV